MSRIQPHLHSPFFIRPQPSSPLPQNEGIGGKTPPILSHSHSCTPTNLPFRQSQHPIEEVWVGQKERKKERKKGVRVQAQYNVLRHVSAYTQ
jgi:hypothetical protein